MYRRNNDEDGNDSIINKIPIILGIILFVFLAWGIYTNYTLGVYDGWRLF